MRSLVVAVVFVLGCGRTHDFVATGIPDAAPDAPPCTLVTCETEHATCGPIGDGCEGTVGCGDRTAPDCGGGDGTPFTCGGGTGSGA